VKFVDSSFWIGLQILDDQHHTDARALAFDGDFSAAGFVEVRP
jgi:hypothetical protein